MSHGHAGHFDRRRKTLRIREQTPPSFVEVPGPVPLCPEAELLCEWGYHARFGIFLHELVESETGAWYHRVGMTHGDQMTWETRPAMEF